MSRSHIGSRLPLSKYVIPIDENTVQLNHFDISAEDISGIRPTGAYTDDSCMLYFDMNNVNENIIYDSSRHNNYGVIHGATRAYGRNGLGLSFDGINDYILVNKSPTLNATTELTLEAWIKPGTQQNGTGSSSSIIILGHYAYYLVIDSNLAIGTYWYGRNPEGYHFTTDNIVSPNSWNHIAAVWDSSYVRIYVNGTLQYEQESTGVGYPIHQCLWIGAEPSRGRWFNGSISKAVVYNRALSQQEISEHYNESIYTLLKWEGKYGGAIAVEESTTNLCIGLGGNYYDVEKIHHEDRNYCSVVEIDGKKWLKFNKLSGTYLRLAAIPLKPSTTYTWSFTVYTDTGKEIAIYHWDSSGDYGTIFETVDACPKRIVNTFTTRGITEYDILHIAALNEGQDYYFADFQLEEKPYATSYTTGARDDGKLIYPNPVIGLDKWTISYWTRAYDIQNANWYMRTLIKDGDILRIYINDTLESETAGMSDCLKYDMYLSVHEVLNNGSPMLLDELRIDSVARSEDEIIAWYVSGAPFYPKGIQRVSSSGRRYRKRPQMGVRCGQRLCGTFRVGD